MIINDNKRHKNEDYNDIFICKIKSKPIEQKAGEYLSYGEKKHLEY